MSEQFDAVVIGGGPGGYTCAAQLAEYGLKTALIERDLLGGTCLNRGCIPTKTLLHSADLLREIQHGEVFGLKADGIAVDFPSLRARKDTVVRTLRGGVQQMLAAAKVTVFAGTGFVPQAGIVEVTGSDGSVQRLETKNIIAAVGTEPALPPIPGLKLSGVMTSDGLLADVPELVSLTIIGGGVIGVEFASIYASLGTRVTILEGMPGLLPGLDREIGQGLALQLKKRGVAVVTGAMVREVTLTENGLCCRYAVREKEAESVSQAVLVAVGRRAAPEKVFAPEMMPDCEKGRIVVDGQMRAGDGLYVIGDAAAGYPQLAHAASEQGLAAAAAIAGKAFAVDLSLVPSCVYTQPEIASVGMTEAEAKAAGISVHSGKYPTAANGKSVLTGQERGFIKIVADDSGKLIGAQMMCAHATDMIGELTLAIANGLTEEQVLSVIRPHPTFEEAIGEAVRISLRKRK